MFDDISPSNSGRASGFGESFKILFRWKHSVYRLLWEPFLIYVISYISLSLLYDYVLSANARVDFEAIAAYCSKYTSSLPIVLLLGFFTSTSMQRWFSVFNTMPGTAKVIAIFVLALKENAADGAQMIQQYSRWILLSWTFTFRLICQPLKKLYPDLQSLQNAGLMLEHERIHLEQVQSKHSSESDHYLSLAVLDWNLAMLKRCSRQGLFTIPADCNRQVDALMAFKKSCCNTLKFSSKNIPVALIQVVTITVYSIGVASLMARQLADKNPATSFITGYFPMLNTFQYFLYLSWLRFGAMASNPFGEDDDDIDITKLLQSHIEDAQRLQALYVTGPADELVTTSIETPSKKWPRNLCVYTDEGAEQVDGADDDGIGLTEV
ncbi:bestrophin-3 isoform X1 [Daphnia magna]|uniref:Uncharacterized protein n=2 Tax=Daphnia magna TaxID=35525 RepID=A0ABQ9ZVE8_9CRUS|nr:bestrophin-3 isoform X1 [Daphnia magna]KAK4016896.1 hypothetical protein OUZ56_031860 [Daphnia magna]KZS04565.1 Uncharacterized protein APZ42_032866 [Daphnia magna]